MFPCDLVLPEFVGLIVNKGKGFNAVVDYVAPEGVVQKRGGFWNRALSAINDLIRLGRKSVVRSNGPPKFFHRIPSPLLEDREGFINLFVDQGLINGLTLPVICLPETPESFYGFRILNFPELLPAQNGRSLTKFP